MKVYLNNKIIKNDDNLEITKCVIDNKILKITYENNTTVNFYGVKKESVKIENGELIDNTINSVINERVAEIENVISQLLIGDENNESVL